MVDEHFQAWIFYSLFTWLNTGLRVYSWLFNENRDIEYFSHWFRQERASGKRIRGPRPDYFWRFSFILFNLKAESIRSIIKSDNDLSLDGEVGNDFAAILNFLYTIPTIHGKMEGFQIFKVTYDFQKLKNIIEGRNGMKTKVSSKMKMTTHTAQRRTATAISCASCNE